MHLRRQLCIIYAGGSTKLEEAQPQHVLHAEQAARKQSFKEKRALGSVRLLSGLERDCLPFACCAAARLRSRA